MTETTAETRPQEHEQPCFCNCCLPLALSNLIDERAKLLQAALDDRLYTPGFERDLADELIAAIPAASRGAALEFMLEWHHLEPRVMVVDCLLDECDSRSYEALHEMTRVLLDAIHAQGDAPHALRRLVINAICTERELVRVP